MQSLEVTGAVRPLYGSLGVMGLKGQCDVYRGTGSRRAVVTVAIGLGSFILV